MTYPRMRRVPRCPVVSRGVQCNLPRANSPTRRGYWHWHRFDPNDAGYADWRRRFAKVRVPR